MSGVFPERVGTLAPGRWRILLFALVGLLGAGVLAGLVVTVHDASRARDRTFVEQARGYETLILARSVDANLADATAILSRLVMTGDARTGYAFEIAWTDTNDALEQLAAYGVQSPEETKRIATLRRLIDGYGDQLSSIAHQAETGRRAAASLRLNQLARTRTQESVARTVEAITASVRTDLTARKAAAEQSVQHANTVAVSLLILAIGIILAAIGLGAMMVGALRDRAWAHAEAEVAQQRAEELESAIAQAVADLMIETSERAEAEDRLRQIQKMEAIGQLTGGIAHDFNNMLAVVIGGLELARRQIGSVDPIATRHIDSATEGAQRAAALTRQLLAFARAEPLVPASIEVGALIAGMRDLLDRALGDGVRIVVTDSGRGWNAWIDPHGLENVVLNLAVNSRDAMNGRGRIDISLDGVTLAAGAVGACAAGDYVSLAVSDDGCGMSPEVLARAFEPFFTTKPVGKGTGLGLSQIFGFVRGGGGEITIRSAPGAGTTVIIYLPRHHAGDAAPARPRLRTAVAPNVTPLPRPAPDHLSVLVVEDDPRVLAATMEALKELGHRPVACSDPLLAPDLLARTARIDLILSDVLMPHQTGPEMIAALLPRHPHLAVLFVTGYAADAGDATEFAGHVVLRKPYTLAALEAAIGEALALRPIAAETAAA